MVVARSQTKRAISKARHAIGLRVSSRVELIKDASNSVFTKNPIRRVFPNPVTFVEHAAFGISYPFYLTERPYTSTITQLAGEENAKVTFTTTNQDLRVSHDRHSAACSCNGSICTMMNVYWVTSSLLC